MKTLIKILGLILGIGLIIAVIGGIFYISNPSEFKEFFNGKYEAASIEEEAKIAELKLGLISENVEFFVSDEEKLKIEYGKSERLNYKYECENGVVNFTENVKWWDIKNWLDFGLNKPDFKVYLPKSFDGKVEVDGSSGDILIDKLPSSKISYEIDISSGKVKLANVTLDFLDIEMSSGAVVIEKCTINEAKIESSSGSVKATDSELKKLNFSCSSGSIESTKVKSNEVKIDLSSGSAKMSLDESVSDWKIECSASSGSFTISEKDKKLIETSKSLDYGNGTKKFDFSCSSGNLILNFEK